MWNPRNTSWRAHRSANRSGRRLAAVAVAGSLIAAGLLATTSTAGAITADNAGHHASRADADLQRRLDALVRDDGFPGVLASVRDRDGSVHNYTAGVGDLKTGAKVPEDGEVRIASNTKTFVATVVLQLVGEGKVDLDAPIETYLPNLVRGNGNDGTKITVRELLQHTSGLPDYTAAILSSGYLPQQHTYFEPRQLVDAALSQPALSAPGAEWHYSNTNYILAGLLVQTVTGRPIGEEITNRVINRLGLRQTYWPAQGDQTIRGPHPHGYWPGTKPGDPLIDVTENDPSLGWAAGQLISTPSDFNRFFTGLLAGKLLEPAQLKEMETTVAAPGAEVRGDERYGLGLETFTLSCGGFAWSHGGNAPGFATMNAATPDGRAVTVATTVSATTAESARHVEQVVDSVICKQ